MSARARQVVAYMLVVLTAMVIVGTYDAVQRERTESRIIEKVEPRITTLEKTIRVQGKPGPAGRTGSPGAQGSPGTIGLRGFSGSQGPKGDRGLRGERGARGSRGPRGSKGSRGLIGPTPQVDTEAIVQEVIGRLPKQASPEETANDIMANLCATMPLLCKP